MTQNRYLQPDPPVSEHAQAPPSAAHSNLPGDEGVWAAARRSYVEGCSTPVVAERHGLNERTVRRRAADEDWRGLRMAELRARMGAPPPFAGEPQSEEEAFERHPQLAPFVAAHGYEVGELLMRPDPARLLRFAFRRSSEAAARGAPAEALSWIRLAQAAQKLDPGFSRLARPFADADHMRAAYAEALKTQYEEGLYGEEDGEAEDKQADAPSPEPAPEVKSFAGAAKALAPLAGRGLRKSAALSALSGVFAKTDRAPSGGARCRYGLAGRAALRLIPCPSNPLAKPSGRERLRRCSPRY